MTYLEEPLYSATAAPGPATTPDTTEPTEQLRYFIRSTRKRAGSETAEQQGDAKRVRAMITQIISGIDNDKLDLNELKDLLREDFETIFPTEIIVKIDVPRIYKEAINDPKYVE